MENLPQAKTAARTRPACLPTAEAKRAHDRRHEARHDRRHDWPDHRLCRDARESPPHHLQKAFHKPGKTAPGVAPKRGEAVRRIPHYVIGDLPIKALALLQGALFCLPGFTHGRAQLRDGAIVLILRHATGAQSRCQSANLRLVFFGLSRGIFRQRHALLHEPLMIALSIRQAVSRIARVVASIHKPRQGFVSLAFGLGAKARGFLLIDGAARRQFVNPLHTLSMFGANSAVLI